MGVRVVSFHLARENLKTNNYPENNADSKTDIINSCYISSSECSTKDTVEARISNSLVCTVRTTLLLYLTTFKNVLMDYPTHELDRPDLFN